MGELILKVAQGLFGRGLQMRIMMLGLDSAGKTTILYKTKLKETVTTIPTIGFNVETVYPVKGVALTVFDIGGQDMIMALFRHYLSETDGMYLLNFDGCTVNRHLSWLESLLYVVDSTDMERMEEAREELFNVLDHENRTGVPVVILANKQDVLGAMTAEEVTKHLYLNQLTGRNWFVKQTCALTGDGILKGFKQLATLTKEFKRSKR